MPTDGEKKTSFFRGARGLQIFGSNKSEHRKTHRELRQEARRARRVQRLGSKRRPLMSPSALEHQILVVVAVEIDAAPDKRKRSIFDEEAVFVAVFFLREEPESDSYACSCSGGDEREPREPPEPRSFAHRRQSESLIDGRREWERRKFDAFCSFFLLFCFLSLSHTKLFFSRDARACFVLSLSSPTREKGRYALLDPVTGHRSK